MADQFNSVLEEISFPEELAKNLNDRLPKILNVLEEDSQSSYFLQIITTLLGPVVGQLDVEVYEREILQFVLPCIKGIFENSLNEIIASLENVDEFDEDVSITLSKLLQVCLDILFGYGEFLEKLLSKNSIKAEDVKSLHKTLPSILLKAFGHCRDSETMYGIYFADSTTILSAFFKKSYEVQTKYYKSLEDKIDFYASYEDDLNMLNKILDKICSIGNIVVGLDLKSSIDIWRPYCKLAHKYADHLKQRLNVAKPLILMCGNVKDIIFLLTNSQEPIHDKSKRMRYLKMGGFVLKVIIRLCETYKNYLGDCTNHLFELLLLLFRRSKDDSLDESTRDELERFITVGATSLLYTLIEDGLFFNSFLSVTERIPSLPLETKQGLLFLIIALEAKLIQCTKEVQEIWSKYNFIEATVDLYESCGLEVNFGMGFEGETIYSKLISCSVAYIICTFHQTTFSITEKYLIIKLFQTQFHTAIFISDLLNTLCRFSNAQVSCDLVTYLCNLLTTWPENKKCRPEFVIVGLTASRLFRLIPKYHTSFFTKYPVENNSTVWYWLGRGNKNIDNIHDISVELNEKFKSLQTIKNCSSFSEFTSLLKLIWSTDNFNSFTDTEGIFTGIIFCLQCYQNVGNKDELSSFWTDEFFYSLLQFSSSFLFEMIKNKNKNCNQQVLEIISFLREILISSNVNSKLLIAAFLKKISNLHIISDQNQQNIFKGVAHLFLQLLRDGDIFVRQKTLESISLLAHNSRYEEVIKTVLSDNVNLRKIVTAYLQTSVINKPSCKHSEVLKLIKGEFHHKCTKRKEFPETEVLQPPAKKIKMNEEENCVFQTLQRVSKDVRTVKEYAVKLGVTSEMKKLICEILIDLNSIENLPPD